MLKALELHGFKSFADKTRFEFPHGITVVVGPNGSGKSNVVDAIKWVLGEQSAKSLRGAEMADVIFKGSGGGGRKPANTAEVAIIFDNEQGLLPVESPEVRVARRVYRSGEGEYLINGQPCRLRDVRDLFRGTGVGTDAYSLIEQGKVDTLLQASPRERRGIFEEAAGISRFKAKKIESKRRLERVEQNLLRLSDIVEEVERRRKSLRNQATKARRYREYTDRLKELRTHVALVDYRQISAELAHVEASLADTQASQREVAARSQAVEASLRDADRRLGEIQADTRRTEQQLARNREIIAGTETTLQLQRTALHESEQEEARLRIRLATLGTRAGDVQLQLRKVRAELEAAEANLRGVAQRMAEAEAEIQGIDGQLLQRRDSAERRRQELQLRQEAMAGLRTQLQSLEADLNLAQDAMERSGQRLRQSAQHLSEVSRQCAQRTDDESRRKQQLDDAVDEQERAQARLSGEAARLAQGKDELSEVQQQLTATTERVSVLEDVQRRLEGVGAGAKELLNQARGGIGGPLDEVLGLVADLLEVKVEMAPVIDAALGERSQYVVVSGDQVPRGLADGSLHVGGRVGLISLTGVRSLPAAGETLRRERGVIGRADEYTQARRGCEPLARYLLGSTLLVDGLSDALRLRAACSGSTCPRFVTRAGEVLEPDGAIVAGPRDHALGLVSRRSELRVLRSRMQQLTEQQSVLQQKVTRQRELMESAEQELRQSSTRREAAAEAFAAAHARAEAARQLEEQTKANHHALDQETRQLGSRQQELVGRRAAVVTDLAELEHVVTDLQQRLSQQLGEVANLERERQAKQQRATAAKIELATVEQTTETLRAQVQRCEQDNEERSRAITELKQQLDHGRLRRSETSRAILNASSVMAEHFWQQQINQQQLRELRRREDEIARRRVAWTDELNTHRGRGHELEQALHQWQLQAGELRIKQGGVAERIRDEYGIELSEIQELSDEHGQRGEVEREIQDLRLKISNIGAVNMESLAELDELEERFETLSSQYNDLVQAKESLQRIISRINVDSRKMFLRTLEEIRENFRALFRRAFGGGQADIVVEDAEDVLECGVDIVATPPGKHSLNMSLLSGGERALTAVTLLLAIFRYRPSPFCVLDEVDGPLDEANIGRFVDVLHEFLSQTKIVIVTHSKKTMSAATTLYGVTMQESGVSKRVSVQFNDVSEDGHIREGAGQESDGSGEAA